MHAYKRLLRHLTATAKYSDEDIDKMTVDEARANLRKCMAEEDEEAEDDDEDDEDEDEEEEEDEEEDDEDEPGDTEAAGRTLAADRRRIKRLQALCGRHNGPAIDSQDETGTLRRMPLFAAAARHGWSVRDVRELLGSACRSLRGRIQRRQFIGTFPSEPDGREPSPTVRAMRLDAAKEIERVDEVTRICSAHNNPSVDFARDRNNPSKTRRRDLAQVAIACGWSAADTRDLIARHLRGPVAPGVSPHLQGPVWDEP